MSGNEGIFVKNHGWVEVGFGSFIGIRPEVGLDADDKAELTTENRPACECGQHCTAIKGRRNSRKSRQC